MATEAQIRANRQNCLKSTGPRSAEGKEISRANSLKHGLRASVVVPEGAELIRARSLEMFDSLAPQDEFQTWICNRVALLTIRVDRSERMERRSRDKVCLRAFLTWDVDREAEVERLGARLSGRPEEVSKELRRTKHGCEWLIRRWRLLAHAAVANAGGWTDAQARLAFDLLGTPPAFREGGRPGLELDDNGRVIDEATDQAAVARRQVEALEGLRDLAAEVDEVDRHLAESDLSHDADAECRRLRRYETRLHREIRWSIAQLQSDAFERRTRPDLRPSFDAGIEPEPAFESDAAPDPAPEPISKPEPKSADEVAAEGWTPELIHPPFDLEPDEFPEPGQSADIPAILRSREVKRRARAEARRDARRRKLERLRS